MDVQEITLDIGRSPSLQRVVVGQGDEGTVIRATILDGESPLTPPSDATCWLCIGLPDSLHYVRQQASLTGNVAEVALSRWATQVAGVTDTAYFSIEQGVAVVCSTARFTYEVQPAAAYGAVPAASHDELADAARKAIADIDSKIAGKAESSTVEAMAKMLGMAIGYYTSVPTEDTVKSDHGSPCLVVVAGGSIYLVS